MAKILLIEDDASFVDVLTDWLTGQGHQVELAHTGDEGLLRLKEAGYDVIILDWQLPGHLQGPDLCQILRKRNLPTPIIMLTGKNKVHDKATGLDAGADDYLTKPFETEELGARLRALLRRPGVHFGATLKFNGIELCPQTKNVLINGNKVVLLPREFALLEFLMRNPNFVFSPEVLMQRVWPSDTEASISAVRTYIKTLRKKICPDDPDKSPIRNIYGSGYKFETE